MSTVLKVTLVTQLIFHSLLVFGTQEDNINLITENIMKVCDKPENAGSYWDVQVKGDGEAAIKLKLAKLGVTGEAAFSKGEWEGIQRTVEDNKDYRDCVKSLSPLFLEKFIPVIQTPEVTYSEKRILGGVKWQEFGQGVKVTLQSCSRQSNSVICEFNANAVDDDVAMHIYGSSAIYDQNGNKYIANYASISNFKSSFKRSTSRLEGELIKGVDTKIKIRFSSVDSNAIILVSKAMLNSYIKGNSQRRGDKYEFSFRNVKIIVN